MLTTYTVCGIYPDTGQCYTDFYTAHSPAAAILAARTRVRRQSGAELLIAAVLAGRCEAVDDLTYAEEGPGSLISA